MESYIECKIKLYNTILEFLEGSDEINQQCFKEFCENMHNFNIEGDREEMAQFLSILKSISDHHHRDADFNANIKKILKHFQDQIKQTLSNEKIFRIFESNKLIVLFLLKNGIIDFTETIYKELINNIEANGNRYCHFFYPELEKLKGAKAMKSIKEEIL
ncbi:hypothetical protein M9Y10_016044 [Tritrichomonas musculus]|uniref:Uncharacterized protein n=1 Tax=Tritrichomonas musculus TaxID=1915356 RepID=A0ABR2I5B8_9EUKA